MDKTLFGSLADKISKVQTELKAPKGQFNKFGNYNYRSCEDILEAVKPLLKEHSLFLTVNDEIVAVGDRVYVKATATLASEDNFITSTAYAREPLNRKGMDEAQVTGASSSYARKYALNGLFAIDDNKDPDVTNTHDKEPKGKVVTSKPKVKDPGAEASQPQKNKIKAMCRNIDGMQLSSDDNANYAIILSRLKDKELVLTKGMASKTIEELTEIEERGQGSGNDGFTTQDIPF